MGIINYKEIYDKNMNAFRGFYDNPYKYEQLIAGHYSESNHFIYELLQNAEDEGAKAVAFEYYPDKLVFYHDGKPFDQNDVAGIASLLEGTKTEEAKRDKESTKTIGKFGMGFKSVYKYTNVPEIYTDQNHFVIERYLFPEERPYNWDFIMESKNIKYQVEGEQLQPFIKSKHLTKIILPYRDEVLTGSSDSVEREDILNKLIGLEPEILLFLTNITELVWTDKRAGKSGYKRVENNNGLVTIFSCATNEEMLIKRYLKITNQFNHPSMKNAEVSIAYALNEKENIVLPLRKSRVWVYFPTKDTIELPFIVHGSFNTPVSREKLMYPSKFNRDLFEKVEDLIVDSMTILREKKMLNQGFIRQILLPTLNEEENLPGIRTKIRNIFKCRDLLLTYDSKFYKKPDELKIIVPPNMLDSTMKILGLKASSYIYFRDINAAGAAEHFRWLTEELGIEIFGLDNFYDRVIRTKLEFKETEEILKVFQDNMSYVIDSSLSGKTQKGMFDNYILPVVQKVYPKIKYCRIFYNQLGECVEAYGNDGQEELYIEQEQSNVAISKAHLMHKRMELDFEKDFWQLIGIAEYNNYQYICEKILPKYSTQMKALDMFADAKDKQYYSEIKNIVTELADPTHREELIDKVKTTFLIKCFSTKGNPRTPQMPKLAYFAQSLEGMDLTSYFSGNIIDEYDAVEGEYIKSGTKYLLVNENVYLQNGITHKELRQLGIVDTVVTHVEKNQRSGDWEAIGDYLPEMQVELLSENLTYIKTNDGDELSRLKSKAIYVLAYYYYKNMLGQKKHVRGALSYQEEENRILKILKTCNWIYDNDYNLKTTSNLSKFDLCDIYGNIHDNNEFYSVMGFAKKDKDKQEDILKAVGDIDSKSQFDLLHALAAKLGVRLVSDTKGTEGDTFVYSDNMNNEFPSRSIQNYERLAMLIKQEVYCANPVKYQSVMRQIRVSKKRSDAVIYVKEMYRNNAGNLICQFCRNIVDSPDVVEISQIGIEMEQNHLCLCPDCSRKYKNMVKLKKSVLIDFIDRIEEYRLEEGVGIQTIEVSDNTTATFTSIHLAELQEIYKLIRSNASDNESVGTDREVSNYIINIAREVKSGDTIVYSNAAGKEIKVKVNLLVIPELKDVIGKKIGDSFIYNGKQVKLKEIYE